MFNATPGRPFRAAVGAAPVDMYDTGLATATGVLVGAKLAAGAAAAATCQLVDADGTVLWDGAANQGSGDWLDIPVIFRGKVRLAALAGAGSSVLIYVE